MLCTELAEAVTANGGELSESNRLAATRALVDCVAAAMCGAEHPAPTRLRAATAATAGQGACEVVGSARLVDARTAALVNGTASHAMEVDDIYRDGLYHPGAPTVAAALATAQMTGAGGSSLLAAIAVGYEVSCRIARAVNPSHYQYWHTTGTVGALGAAVAAGRILEIPAAQLAHALAVATTAAAGLQQSFRSEAMSKPFHAGHAADAGVLAALAAAQGFTGALDVLEGAAGFGAGMSAGAEWGGVTIPWAEPWAVAQVTVKNHTACGHTFAPIDAVLALRHRHGLSGEDVESIRVETASTPIQVAGNRDPQTEFEAKFSIPYCAAAALRFGSVRLEAFSATALSSGGLRDLAGRVELVAAPEFDEVFPNQRGARVSLRTRDGSALSETVWTRHGDPDDPLSDDEVTGKFVELTSPLLGSDVGALLKSLWAVSGAPSVEGLLVARR